MMLLLLRMLQSKCTRQTSKNSQKSACRFLEIFGDFCPICGDFLSDFMARIAKKSEILFLINRRADTKIVIFRFLYRYSGLQIGVRRYKNRPCRFMTDFNKTQVDINKIQE